MHNNGIDNRLLSQLSDITKVIRAILPEIILLGVPTLLGKILDQAWKGHLNYDELVHTILTNTAIIVSGYTYFIILLRLDKGNLDYEELMAISLFIPSFFITCSFVGIIPMILLTVYVYCSMNWPTMKKSLNSLYTLYDSKHIKQTPEPSKSASVPASSPTIDRVGSNSPEITPAN